jgi:Glyoxalase-like domain
VLLAASDLTAAASDLQARYGLASLEGGRHAGWGTANRIVPLGETYLELVSVVDEAEAATSSFGSWVSRALPALAKPLGWAVRTQELDDVGSRLGIPVVAKSRATADGRVLRWRVAGIEQATAEPSLPFFIEWARDAPFPGSQDAAYGAGGIRIAELQLSGDADRLAGWLGEHDLPVSIVAGDPAVVGATLRAGENELHIVEAGRGSST